MTVSVQWRDLWTRVWKTFVQGAVGVFALTYFGPLFDLVQSFVSLGPGDELPQIDLTFWRNGLLAIIAGGAAAVLSLVWNLILEWKSRGEVNRLAGMPADQAAGDQVLEGRN